MGEVTNQARVLEWGVRVLGYESMQNRSERAFRVLEESIELAQACACDREAVHRLVDYVYARPEGKPEQEIAGIMMTLYAAAVGIGCDAQEKFEEELVRVNRPEVIERVQQRQLQKRQITSVPRMYYFGYAGPDAGHSLNGPHGADLTKQERSLTQIPFTPAMLDGGEFLPGAYSERGRWKHRRLEQSECKLTHVSGWTLMAFWDRSGDPRPGSNSTFLCEGRHDFDAMRAMAREQHPLAMKRIEAVKPLYLPATEQ